MWVDGKKIGLAELLKKLATLHSKILELRIKQKAARVLQQVQLIKAQNRPQKPKETK